MRLRDQTTAGKAESRRAEGSGRSRLKAGDRKSRQNGLSPMIKPSVHPVTAGKQEALQHKPETRSNVLGEVGAGILGEHDLVQTTGETSPDPETGQCRSSETPRWRSTSQGARRPTSRHRAVVSGCRKARASGSFAPAPSCDQPVDACIDVRGRGSRRRTGRCPSPTSASA